MLSHYAKAAAESNPELDQNEVKKVLDAVSTQTGGIIADLNMNIGRCVQQVIIRDGIPPEKLYEVAIVLVKEYLETAAKNSPLIIYPETIEATQTINILIEKFIAQIIKTTGTDNAVAIAIVQEYLINASSKVGQIYEGFLKLEES